jgi:hypothetical protein
VVPCWVSYGFCGSCALGVAGSSSFLTVVLDDLSCLCLVPADLAALRCMFVSVCLQCNCHSYPWVDPCKWVGHNLP